MSEIVVNTTTSGLQHEPAVASFRGTHFIVVWTDTSDRSIKRRVFMANGAVGDDELIVNTPTTAETNIDRHLPAVLSVGQGAVVAWIELPLNPPGPIPHVKLQSFDSDLRKIGSEVQVSTSDVDPRHRPSIAFMIDGGFVVTWMDARPDQRIRAQRFGFGGNKVGGEFLVNTTEGFHESPISTALEGGTYVIAWRSDPSAPEGGGLTFRLFDFDGSPLVDEIRPNLFGFTGEKAISNLDGGRFAIAHVRSGGTSDIGIERSTIDVDVFEGNAAFSDISVDPTTGQGISCSSPALAGLPGGRFVVAWAQKSAETVVTSTSVRARLCSDFEGTTLGEGVQLNTTTEGERRSVWTATAFGGGERDAAFVVWTDNSGIGGDPSDLSVRAGAVRMGPAGLVPVLGGPP